MWGGVGWRAQVQQAWGWVEGGWLDGTGGNQLVRGLPPRSLGGWVGLKPETEIIYFPRCTACSTHVFSTDHVHASEIHDLAWRIHRTTLLSAPLTLKDCATVHIYHERNLGSVHELQVARKDHKKVPAAYMSCR